MDLVEFSSIYLNPSLDKIKYDHHAPTDEFVDPLYSHMFLPRIMQPIRVTSNSKY